MKCSDCLGDEYCWDCGGCRECLAKEFDYEWHCAVCLACDSVIDFCQECGVCEDCCLCGVTSGISGTVSGNKKTDTIDIELIPYGEEEPIFKKTATGDKVDYSFDNVPAGKYLLRITKNGETVHEENILVGKNGVEHDVAIEGDPDVEILLGDVNQDDVIDMFDYLMVKSFYFEVTIPTDDQSVRADMNEDDVIDMFDYLMVKTAYFRG